MPCLCLAFFLHYQIVLTWEKPFVRTTGILQVLYNSHMSSSLLRQENNSVTFALHLDRKLLGMNKKNSVGLQCSEPFSLSQLQKPSSSFLQPTLSLLAHPLFFCTRSSPRRDWPGYARGIHHLPLWLLGQHSPFQTSTPPCGSLMAKKKYKARFPSHVFYWHSLQAIYEEKKDMWVCEGLGEVSI